MIKEINKPNFFIVGSPRSGTTAMYEFLRQHPEIFMSAYKEPHFFSTDLKPKTPWERKMRTEKGYGELFKNVNKEKAIGEASVYYLFSKSAAKNIHEYNPKAKIVVMLRSPIEVAHSLFFLRQNNGYENVDTLSEAIKYEDLRRKGKKIPKGSIHFTQSYCYGDVVKFGEQLLRYYKYFSKKQVFVIRFKDFKENPGKVYKDLCKFLGVSTTFEPKFSTINQSKVARNKRIAYFLSNPPDILRKIVIRTYSLSKYFFKLIEKINSQTVKRKLTIDDDFKNQFNNKLKKDIDILSRLTKTSPNYWY